MESHFTKKSFSAETVNFDEKRKKKGKKNNAYERDEMIEGAKFSYPQNRFCLIGDERGR